MLLLAGAAFAVGYGVTAIFFFDDADAPEVVAVPDLRRLPVAQAERLAAGAGLALVRGDSLPNPTVPRGSVLAQTPLPGQEVAPQSEVRVLLSTGPERRNVPDVSRLRGAMAARALQAAGFEVLLEEDTSMVPAGRVIEIDPPMGTPVELPARVRLRVSLGPPSVVVPRLVGLALEAARDSLRARGLDADAEHVFHWRSPPGEVLTQEPRAGETISVGDTVQLTVAADRVLRFRRDGNVPRPD